MTLQLIPGQFVLLKSGSGAWKAEGSVEDLGAKMPSPHEVIQTCLGLCRKVDRDRLQNYLWAPPRDGNAQTAGSGHRTGQEQGPLAPLSSIFDVGARRVLPGHLLRRSQVLSSLQLGPGRYQQRIALTACTGEEAVFVWTLAAVDGGWLVCAVQRDPATDWPLPAMPHPRASPEAVVHAQLAAIQSGDIPAAAKFMHWPHQTGNGPWSLQHHQQRLAAFAQQSLCSMLLGRKQVVLGAASLPTQRRFLQHVHIQSDPSTPRGAPSSGHPDPQQTGGLCGASDTGALGEADQYTNPPRDEPAESGATFCWQLGLQASGYWMVEAVTRQE
ncbi:hypothetical protein WJX72_010503 [[Myrmecia] bisecta]|uniref:Uncharacterized protein n=1 Tax=[Myrmecia] bisecta TaxID=41462 RepID=A0AAW1Q864_9CHLO